ncbi:PRC-barrel domain protein [Pseudoduganella lurida]|uniref:PRC-barrel domain protein n=1 Tax=Pseudoduganella lurida TaxID=1036180 RepID=A0A562QZA3_9BURK|nr:PRC-barrel domain-containing protein [Pseudoduganella lurida]TWI62149.1 PRC-barrel domain protein [Pseudoduganella lurida]
MSYERDAYGNYVDQGKQDNQGPGPRLMGADTIIGDHIHNLKDEHLGSVKEIMLDMQSGRVAYVVMASGGVLTIGEKLFAIPWEALALDTANHQLRLNIDKERIENAPGFDKDNWPDMANQAWTTEIHSYYGTTSRSTGSTLDRDLL